MIVYLVKMNVKCQQLTIHSNIVWEASFPENFDFWNFEILKTDNIHEFFSRLRYSTIGHAGTQGHLSCSRGGGGGGALSTRAPTILNWKTKVKKIQFYFKNSSYQSFRYCFQKSKSLVFLQLKF